ADDDRGSPARDDRGLSAMATFQYRAVKRDGSPATGEFQAPNRQDAIAQIRRSVGAPLEVVQIATPVARGARRVSSKDRAAADAMIGELAVLLNAGLPLDRALARAIGNIEHPGAAARLAELLRATREGMPLSRAMTLEPGLFSPEAA